MKNTTKDNREEKVELKNKSEKIKVKDLWENVGFHKAIGGFWYKFGILIFSMVLGFVVIYSIFGYMYPFPESLGYKSAATSIFMLFFTIFDLGTHMTMERYIAEARIKDPQKMVQYIQYFIWYQMITGLIQTTTLAVYALYFVPRSELSYAVWLMLIYSLTQYPGMLGVFSGVLSSLQHFDKAAIVGFISSEIGQRLTEVVFVLLGRWYGETHPEVGMIMGIAIGSIIGTYVDDFLGMVVSAYYFKSIMQKEGIKIRDCFKIDFDWSLVKESAWFGLRTGLPNLLGVSANIIILGMYLTYLPQYTTYIAVMDNANGIARIVSLYGTYIPIQPLITEAYMNNKKSLTEYYISQTIKTTSQIQGFTIPIVLYFASGLSVFFPLVNMSNWLISIPFVYPLAIVAAFDPYFQLADRILAGTDNASILMILRFIEEPLKVFIIWLFLVGLRLPATYGMSATVWVLSCGTVVPTLIKTLIAFIFIHKKIARIKVPIWQAYGTSFIGGAAIYFIAVGTKMLLADPYHGAPIELVGMFISFLAAMFSVSCVYFPLTTLLGGWDDDSLVMFRKGAMMSGVAKIFVMPMYKAVEITSKRSKLHNRFQIPHEDADREVKELLEMKKVASFQGFLNTS
ncbi:MAG: hypothetical protein ACTSXP_17790 [Promethearchaeota archaeon]